MVDDSAARLSGAAVHAGSSLKDAMFSAMLDPIVILGAVRDTAGRIVDFEYLDANPTACAYNRLSHDELVGTRMLDLFPALADTQLVVNRRVVETGEPLAIDAQPYPNEAFGGQERFYDIRAAKLGDGLFYTWRDVTDRVVLERQVRSDRERLRAQLDAEIASHVTLTAVRDGSGTIVDFVLVDANTAALAYLGLEVEQLFGTRLVEMFPSAPAQGLRELCAHTVDTGEPLIEDDYLLPNQWFGGRDRWYLLRGAKLCDGISLSWEDVTDRHLAAQRIAESEERYRLLAENAADIVLVIKDGVVDWISPSVERAFGSRPSDALGMAAGDLVHPDDVPVVRDVMAAVLRGEDVRFRVRAVGPDDVEHWVEAHARPFVEADGQISGLIASYHVIDQVIEAEAELDRRARFDSLTGLLNRPEILQTLTQVTGRTPRSGTQTAVLFCDVDRFKEINDEHGHAAGDEVLRIIAERVAATIRADDYAARIGGDELLILLPGVHSLDEAMEVAEKLRNVAGQRIALDHGVGITPQLSIGVTLLRTGETSDEVVDRADHAMYLAKKSGRNRVVAV